MLDLIFSPGTNGQYNLAGEGCSVRIKEGPLDEWTIFVHDNERAFKLVVSGDKNSLEYYVPSKMDKVIIVDDYNAKLVEAPLDSFGESDWRTALASKKGDTAKPARGDHVRI